jgi:hypothetical protein
MHRVVPPAAMPTPPRMTPARMTPARQPFPRPAANPFGAGNFSDELAKTPKKGGGGLLKVAAVLLLVAVGGGGYWYYASANKAGRIEVTMVPADATVLIDNAKVGDHSPLSIDRPPGPYTLSVTREGYERSDQNIEVHAGQQLPLQVALEPSPDTGFELTSEPPGGLVWLDGAAIKGAAGQQARTDFRAFRIAPGHHVLEIKGENRFKPWRQDIEVQPGAIAKVHAMLIPASGAPAGKSGSHQEVAQAPPVTTTPPLPAPTPPPPPAVKPPPPAHEAAVVPPPAPTPPPHTPHHKKSHEVALDDGAGPAVASAPADDDSGGTKAADKGGDCTMTVNSVPWSEVWIDGKNTSQHTPIVDYKISCGRHKLAFKRTDMQIDQTESINVKPGQNFKQRYTLATDE